MASNTRCIGSGILALTLLAGLWSGPTEAAVVTFNMKDVAVFSSTAPATITATTGEVIPGGFDNFSAGDEFTLSTLEFDIDGDLDPLSANPELFLDFRIRTASYVGGQVVFDGLPVGSLSGSYVVTRGEHSYLNSPFALGDPIGDGIDETIRDGFSPPGPPENNTFSVAIDEGGPVTQFVEGVDNFVGFILHTGDYGWIRAQYDSTSPGTLTFLDGAYDNSGAPIAAGDSGTGVVDSADFDGDDDVDGDDFLIWQQGFGTTVIGTPAIGDANDDGNVDAADLLVWEGQFGETGAFPVVSGIPEPSAMLLAPWMLALLLRRRQ